MKNILLFLIFFSSLTYAQSSATIINTELDSTWSRPKNLKNLQVNLKSSYQNNPAKIDQEIVSTKGVSKNELPAQVTEIELLTKWLFKPTKKFILIDTFNLNSKIYTGSELPFQNQYSANNDLVSVYVLNRENQIGNLLHTSWQQANSFEINFNLPDLQELNEDHFEIQNLVFYQHQFSKSFSSRINFGAKIVDYKDSYSSFIEATGEQDDFLATIVSIENKLKLSETTTLKLPVSFRKEYYKNKIALNPNGTFNTSGPRRQRETLEIYEIGPEVGQRIFNIQLMAAITNIIQKDTILGAKDLSGIKGKFQASTQIEGIEISINMAFSNLKYDNALVNSSQAGSEKWNEKEQSYAVAGKLPINNKLDLILSAQKEIARDNFFAGKYQNETYQMGLEFNL